MITNLDISFVVAVDSSWENWETADKLCLTPERVINFYLGQDHLCCCTMKAGFYMTIDGEAWGDFDEFESAKSWIDGLEKLIEGEDNIWVWAWEESNMTIKRYDKEIEMCDIHSSGTVAPTIHVNLKDFVSIMIREARNWSNLGKEVRHRLSGLKKKTGYSMWLNQKQHISQQSSEFDNLEDENRALDELDKLEEAIKAGLDNIESPPQLINEKIYLIEDCFPVSLDLQLDSIEEKFKLMK